MDYYLYFKDNKKIKPVEDPAANKKAKEKLQKIFENQKHLIPDCFKENWHKVALYHPEGNIEKAKAIIMNEDDGAYDLSNKLNDLTGKYWVKFTCSWFIFNALPKDLKEEREISKNTQDHPATFSPTMIEGFINFFTKKGQKVLDPFVGIGSTLVACKRTSRIGYGIELNKKYYELCLKRTPEFEKNIFNISAENIKNLKLPEIDFCISSPPYWDVLNRSTHTFHKYRESKGFDLNYSSEMADLGNISDYNAFVERLCNIYFDIYELMKKGGYVVIIMKNVKKGGVMYPLAWDIAKILSKKYTLKDEKIWIQDEIRLAPYGYPFSWASNILHHYCIILQKP
jgi:DNA modification methylase